MQKRTFPLTFLLFLLSYCALAQSSVSSVPAVPEQVSFADIAVRLDPEARRLVQQDVNALVANRQYWVAKLDRVALYFPMIESILINEGVPADFKYLAVQESSLTPDAVSSSAAVGYWQFKRETATDNGMRVDDEIDERKSITASTRGAAQYLKKSNTQFNNWISSLYSYYLGATGISKLIPTDWSSSREISLDGRTDRYILRFFAHKIAIESALKFHQASNRFALIEYPSGGGKTLPAIAEELGVDEFELRKYNRWVLGEMVPADKTYVMAIPVMNDQINDVRQKIVSVSGRKTPEFVQNDVGFPVLRRVTSVTGSKNDPVLYEINGLPGIQAQAGDNAGSLARKAKISVSSFLRYNDMASEDPIIVNDVYYLAKKRKKAVVPYHTVRDAETSRSISQRYGVRLKKLVRYNRMDRNERLAVGRVLWLRERRPASKPIEIINAPTNPVYDRTPSPAVGDVVANRSEERSSTRPVAGSNSIPRNASERKMYQPKLVGGGVTPNDGTSEPAAAQRPEPARTPQPSTTSPAPTPRQSSTTAPTSADGTQRVVIVRSAEPTAQSSTGRPLYPTSPDQVTSRKTTKASPTLVMDSPRSQPAKTPASPEVTARPRERATVESGSYSGPSEQQADGSITAPTKALPRNAVPAVIKSESRPAPATVAEPKAVAETKPTPAAEPKPAAAAPAPVVDRTATTHLVESGQTYYSISKLYGLTVDELLTLNNRTTNDVLAAGQKLTVKATPSATKNAERSSPTTTASGVSYHTVAKGETMFRISKMYDVTIEQIQEWNNLKDVTVKEGQKIKIVK
ncbi:LysM peptidoglycan-binding domain-containing protein [Spirosoma rigui]|uniref:LysM peptidoglycan-binding domain-containing protein n=1 Tax=Spirosoma rigui TaxID=564064 RepID=UPI0009B0C2DC|nr:LysM peptidoglycan-binding domain-containing protein [Spirosoma rigui]